MVLHIYHRPPKKPPEGQAMKIYDIPLKRLILKTEADSKKDARQEGQSGVRDDIAHHST